MPLLVITRPPQFLDPWFNEIEQVWDELEFSVNNLDGRVTTLETQIINDVVTSVSNSGDPQLQGDVTFSDSGSISITQVGNNIDIGGGGATDHGALTGLLDDDHTQYLLANGTRALAGNWSVGNFQLLLMRLENLAVAPAPGNSGRLIFNTTDLRVKVDNGTSFVDVGVTDHGLLMGLGDDDHLQYLLVDGTRAVTGDFTVNGKYKNLAASSMTYESQEDDSGSPVAHILDTLTMLTIPGSRLVSVRNAGVEKFYIDKDGNIFMNNNSLTSTTSLYALIDTDNDSSLERFVIAHDDPNPFLATVLMAVNESGEMSLPSASARIRVGSAGAPTHTLDVDGDADIAQDLTLSVSQLLRSPGDLNFQVDYDNNGSNQFNWKDGTGITVMSLTEPGDLDVAGLLRINSSDASSGGGIFNIGNGGQVTQGMRFDVDDSTFGAGLIETALQVQIRMESLPTRATVLINPQMDVPDGEHVFRVLNNTGADQLLNVYGNGDLEVFGTLIGGSSPFKFSSKTAINDGASAFATLTVINNTLDAGDSFTITDLGPVAYTFTEGVDFVAGIDADATAFNIASAINGVYPALAAQVEAESLLNVVTITVTAPGTAGNGFLISESDAPTDNFTLSGATFSGGTDIAPVAYELDTDNDLTLTGSKLLSLKRFGVEKFSIDKDGNFSGLFVTTVDPSAGDAGIQAAMITVSAAGGGIVQLKKGTYIINAGVVTPAINNVILRGVGKGTILAHDGIHGNEVLDITAAASGGPYACNAITSGNTSITTTAAADAGNVLLGDLVVIEGTDVQSNADIEYNLATANGNPGTGVITLKYPIQRTMSSVNIRARRQMRNIEIQDLTVTVPSAVAAAGIILRGGVDCKIVNVRVEGQFDTSIDLGDCARSSVEGCEIEKAQSFGIRGATVFNLELLKNQIVDIDSGASEGAIQLYLEAVECVISENMIRNTSAYGITVVSGGAPNPRRRTLISDNKIYDTSEAAIQCAAGEVVISNNYIENCAKNGGSASSIEINGSDSVVSGNYVKGGGRNLSVFSGSSRVIVSDNMLLYATAQEALSGNGSFCVYSGNIIKGGATIGLYVGDNGNSATGNVVEGNGTDGIFVASNATNCVISNNTSRNNTGDEIEVHNSAADNLLMGNNCTGGTIREGTGSNTFIGNLGTVV